MIVLFPLILLLIVGFGFTSYRLYRHWRHTPAIRAIAVSIGPVFTGLFAFAFYDRYWRWRDCFNELGRCYDSETGVMVEQAALIWGVPMLFCGFLTLLALWWLLRQRTAPQRP